MSMTATTDRQRWMAVLAKAEPHALAELWDAVPDQPAWRRLRAPETGMVTPSWRLWSTR